MCGGGVSSFGYFPIFPVTDYLLELLRAGQPAKVIAALNEPDDRAGSH